MSAAFAERIQNGFYDSMIAQAKSMEESCLAFADYKHHFFPEADWGSATRYVTPQKKVFHTNIFGEVCGSGDGTQISAKGNHFVGTTENPNYITDTTRVKDTIVLRAPTDAPEALVQIFEDQIGTLNQIRQADADQEADEFTQYTVKEWIKSPAPGETQNMIVITSPPRYSVEDNPGNTSTVPRIEKRTHDGNVKAPPPVPVEDKGHRSCAFPLAFRIGALYDPSILPDYKGDLFKHRRAKLVQHDVRDEEGRLVPPWEIYSALRPGTVVLIMVTLHCYIMGADNIKKRKVCCGASYSIRVLMA
ncbi:hypothetical protein BDN72DRAFT_780458 [Pluteus cervinus]|uniref:Uncharacterized protein n=1 Tax=Pluteus cervinus TaxID=181527 RepID=A0ACD3A269_9AGAR|nr:hypothetical protein BDN72DRAFT_780458 [Pluteus cervinus]